MKSIFLLFVATLLVFGCKKDYELNKSVMVYDDILTDIPAYSEWGYNTFGAYYDREVFISNSTIVPAKVIVTNNEMSFVLAGQIGNSYYHTNSSNNMTLTFKMLNYTPEQFANLISLDNTSIDLKNSNYQVLVTKDSAVDTAMIISGEFTIKRAQNLMVDKQLTEVILSGYFDFKALIKKNPVTISDGRFDVGISINNFYSY